MTFIGIAIFTVYTSSMVTSFGCAPAYSTSSVCADVVMSKRQEAGMQLPVYVGEFSSVNECQDKVRAAKYPGKLDENQRVGELTETACVPKTDGK